MWKAMQADMRIIYYTLTKPFYFKTECPNSMGDQEKVYDLEGQEAWFKTAKIKWGGYFVPGGECCCPSTLGLLKAKFKSYAHGELPYAEHILPALYELMESDVSVKETPFSVAGSPNQQATGGD